MDNGEEEVVEDPRNREVRWKAYLVWAAGPSKGEMLRYACKSSEKLAMPAPLAFLRMNAERPATFKCIHK